MLRGLNVGNKKVDRARLKALTEQSPSMGSPTGAPTGANPNDPSGTGGGNIGTGNVPQSGESNFTGTTQ